MVYKCSVTNCKGNYNSGKKVRIFSFPKDECLSKKWLSAIPRDNFTPTRNSKVCEDHFRKEDFLYEEEIWDNMNNVLVKNIIHPPRLKADAIPTIFPNCPSYFTRPTTSRESAEERRVRLENQRLSKAVEESLKTKNKFDSENSFSTYCEFLEWLNRTNSISDYWTVVKKNSLVICMHLEVDSDNAPVMKCSVVINNSLNVKVYRNNVELQNIGKYKIPSEGINKAQDFFNILDNMSSFCNSNIASIEPKNILFAINDYLGQLIEHSDDEKGKALQFISEQLNLLFCNEERYRYSPHFMIFCSILYTISPHCYRFLKSSGYVIVPHPRTISKVCSAYKTNPVPEQSSENFLSFIKQKFPLLKASDLTVTLMIDEIHIKPYIDYKGGNIVGSAFNNENLANSAFVFMIQSLRSPTEEVVHILPVKKINASQLFEYIKSVVVGLGTIGFNVLCIATDNNAINRCAMGYFQSPPALSIVYQNPYCLDKPLFYLFDSVHLLKCIRNNWLNQKDNEKSIVYPSFESDQDSFCVASFSDLIKLHNHEQKSIVKFSHGLNLKSLYPSNFERQNVKLALGIFNENVALGLIALEQDCNLSHAKTTADFIKLICNWWNIMNVNSEFKGVRFRDVLRNPLTLDGENFKFLEKFLAWLDKWESVSRKNAFTKETHLALSHTTHCIMELTRYCMEELKYNYVLPAKFQTDSLEGRFGSYRTLAGSQYLITLRQLYEVENKLRLQNYLPLTLNSSTFGSVSVDHESGLISDPTATSSDNIINLDVFKIEFSDIDFLCADDVLPILTYISGYCARAAVNKVKCPKCTDNLVLNKELQVNDSWVIRNLDRGGLLYPHPDVVNAVIFSYLTVNKLINEPMEKLFLHNSNQKYIVYQLSLTAINNADFFMKDCSCNDHSPSNILKVILSASTNTFLNNYMKKKNNTAVNQNKKRKLQTVQKPF